jgi:hypothetical protein
VHENKRVTINITEKKLLTLNPDLREKKIFEINKMFEKAKRLTFSQSKNDEYGESSKYVNFTDSNGEKKLLL